MRDQTTEDGYLSDVVDELSRMRARGVRVPEGVAAVIDMHREALHTYRSNGMQVTEMADYVRAMAIIAQ